MVPAVDPKVPAVGETLTPGAAPEQRVVRTPIQAPAAAIAAALARASTADGPSVHVASSERRAEEIGRALAGLSSNLEVLVLPPWDCLPYDRASPSRDIMGRRMRVARRLSRDAGGGCVVITSPEALVQKLPPRAMLTDAFLVLERGRRLDRDALVRFAARTGYVSDDRIDEPGEIAFLGEVIDIFPADAARPVRIVLAADDLIDEIRTYDPLSQRSEGDIERLSLGPASEVILPAIQTEQDLIQAQEARWPGVEHGLPEHYDTLETLFDFVPKARLSIDLKAPARLADVEDHVLEAFEARRGLGGLEGPVASAPGALYLLGSDLQDALAGWKTVVLDLDAIESIPNLTLQRNPGRAFCDYVQAHRDAHHRVVLTGLKHEQRTLAKALARGLALKPEPVADWQAALSAPLGEVVSLQVDLDTGFLDPSEGLVVIAASDVVGGRIAAKSAASATDLLAEPDLRIGDVVLHEDHGVGVLRDLKTVEIDGVEHDTLQLEYHGGDSLLAPIEEIGRIWRYGAEASAVTLDRLKGEGWIKRRAEVSRHVDEAAEQLVALAKAREARVCEPIVPPKAAYAKFAARFAYPETPDQSAAIEAVLADLASGRPMDRLVCGDVGFGKTEVALRAAAAVALSGRQVALAAPTTVLARQHVETFKRRFAGSGIGVAHLSRLVTPSEARAVKKGLESGEVRIVIGTQALGGKDLAFDNLGLMIIDEEQKFGAALKDQLRGLAADGHLLTLTATPIPRTLQAAMVGIQDVSVIASPPARRRPIRTFLAPFDPASLRTALMREKRRGGQSFVVAPRIEDIAPLAERLAKLAPELSVRIAHGGLSADEADAVMVGFADGEGDVLLATNIIESGLDVPRANTMIVWRPDRFGLSQLHQLRGRVGRGRTQGIAYLLSDPQDDLSDATRARLSTLEAFDRLGSGLAISARDLDLRGGGDLVGEDQAGHVKMIGAALYQRLLERAVRVARGEVEAGAWTPDLVLGEAGSIPIDYVPDAVTRIGLYGRLARMETLDEIDAFEEELEDRFGPVPVQATTLLSLARLQALARAAEVRQVRAGPKGVALSLPPRAAKAAAKRLARVATEISLDDGKIVITEATDSDAQRRELVERLLLALAA
ncbi:DEAD/DEAH box helicase [Caulobacter hibisci]|uniref:Transcription-repair-coupling factor n=1 Tax=Caulobacter hibisci TaxID=2035993 RepID=A0ABS0SZX4_9CAUL|nr:DEAD/DEAH box helicase [Caulobacter hibisci]MBI1684142.1 DEAD/DEAH box helicase [Caulobacter hibisci]